MKKYRSKRSKPNTVRKSNVPLIILVTGMLLITVSLAYVYRSGQQTVQAALDGQTEDGVAAQPFIAIHEMGKGPPIPFLPKEDPQPNIAVPENVYDFGTIGPKDVVERSFEIRNTGEAPLTISRAYTTCGCTTAEFSTKVIPLGQVATVNIIFDAGFHDTVGQTVRRGVIIENNDPDQSEAEIWVQAQVSAN